MTLQCSFATVCVLEIKIPNQKRPYVGMLSIPISLNQNSGCIYQERSFRN